MLIVFYAGAQGLPFSQQHPILQELEHPESALFSLCPIKNGEQ
jgi:hypothetical protein